MKKEKQHIHQYHKKKVNHKNNQETHNKENVKEKIITNRFS